MTDRDEELGRFGEEDFINFCNRKNLSCIDVRRNSMYMIADVDFIISKKKISECEKQKILKDEDYRCNLLFDRRTEKRDLKKIEVKTDAISLTTGNIFYETISHNFAGCGAKSMADYWYYVFVEYSTQDEYFTRQVWWIYLDKLREYLSDKEMDEKERRKNIWGIKTVNKLENGDRTGSWLIDIKILEKQGIAKCLYYDNENNTNR